MVIYKIVYDWSSHNEVDCHLFSNKQKAIDFIRNAFREYATMEEDDMPLGIRLDTELEEDGEFRTYNSTFFTEKDF